MHILVNIVIYGIISLDVKQSDTVSQVINKIMTIKGINIYNKIRLEFYKYKIIDAKNKFYFWDKIILDENITLSAYNITDGTMLYVYNDMDAVCINMDSLMASIK